MKTRAPRRRARTESVTHGGLMALVSSVVGIGAHAMGAGSVPTGGQLVVLGTIALAVGVLDARHVQQDRRRRDHGRLGRRWPAIAGLLVGGQLVAHLILSLLGGHELHSAANSSPRMLAWHIAAVPVAAAVLVVAQRLLDLCYTAAAQLAPPLVAPVAIRPAPIGAGVGVVDDLRWTTTLRRRGPPLHG